MCLITHNGMSPRIVEFVAYDHILRTVIILVGVDSPNHLLKVHGYAVNHRNQCDSKYD